MRGITPKTNMPLVIAMAKGSSATGIKIYVSLPPKEVARIAAEAHKQGMKVWAHASISPALPLDAIEAGVDVLTHADLIARQQGRRRTSGTNGGFILDQAVLKKVLDKMVENNVILDATLYVLSASGRSLDIANQVITAAHKAGVQISAGTDGGVNITTNPFPPLHEEMKLLVKTGFTPLEAITSATLISAKTIGIEKTHGTIEIGKTANFVVFDKDPSIDIQNLKTIYLTIKNGQIYRR
jgi:imidazolonepropionase-like amidohydrolase